MAVEINPIYFHPALARNGEYVPEFDLTYYDDIPASSIREIENTRVRSWWESIKKEVVVEHPEVEAKFGRLKSTLQEYMSDSEVAEVENAFMYTYFCHNFRAIDPENRMRKDKVNHYTVHPLAVAQIWAERKLRKETIISSLLHDVREDTYATPEEIYGLFGQVVGQNVEDSTKIRRESKNETYVLQLYKLYLSVKDGYEGGNPEAVLVKIADKLDNMRTLNGIPSTKRREEIAHDTYRIYVPLAKRLGLHDIAEELRYLSLKHMYSSKETEKAWKKRETFNERLNVNTFVSLLKNQQSKGDRPTRLFVEPSHISDFIASQENFIPSVQVTIAYNSPQERDFWLQFISNSYSQEQDATRITQGHWEFKELPFGNIKWNITLLSDKKYDLEKLSLTKRYLHNQNNPEEMRKNLNEKLQDIREIIAKYETEGDVEWFVDVMTERLPFEQIAVFTPRGERRWLNEGSTGADFAYEVNKDLIPFALGIRINGQKEIMPLSTVIKPEDMVEVVTAITWEHIDPDMLDEGKITNTSARNYFKQILYSIVARKKDENLFYKTQQMFGANTAAELDIKAKPKEIKIRDRALEQLSKLYQRRYTEKLKSPDSFNSKEEYEFFEVWNYTSEKFKRKFTSWHDFLYEVELTEVDNRFIKDFFLACEQYEQRLYDTNRLLVIDTNGVIADFSSSFEKIGVGIVQTNRIVNKAETPQGATIIRFLVDPKKVKRERVSNLVEQLQKKHTPQLI